MTKRLATLITLFPLSSLFSFEVIIPAKRKCCSMFFYYICSPRMYWLMCCFGLDCVEAKIFLVFSSGQSKQKSIDDKFHSEEELVDDQSELTIIGQKWGIYPCFSLETRWWWEHISNLRSLVSSLRLDLTSKAIWRSTKGHPRLWDLNSFIVVITSVPATGHFEARQISNIKFGLCASYKCFIGIAHRSLFRYVDLLLCGSLGSRLLN